MLFYCHSLLLMKVSVLSDLGGMDIAEACRRVMDFIMTNELAACYTISGKGHTNCLAIHCYLKQYFVSTCYLIISICTDCHSFHWFCGWNLLTKHSLFSLYRCG